MLHIKRRQNTTSLLTTGPCRSQQGSRTIAQTLNMWINIEKNPHMFDVLDPQNDEEARIEHR